jgi:hypothetical protein
VEEGRSLWNTPLLLSRIVLSKQYADSVKCRERVLNKMSREENQDLGAEGAWLTADTMNLLLLNILQGGKAMTETLWKCDQLRAGQLYNRMMFDTQDEALRFAQRMQQMEPDQVFSIEAIDASQVWN